jgi:hypothetical protein
MTKMAGPTAQSNGCSSVASRGAWRRWGRSLPNSEVAQRDHRQLRDPSRVDSSSHPGNDGHLAGALEAKGERERYPLGQVSSEPVHREMGLSRLKGRHRFRWYENSFRDRCGFSLAIGEEGAAYANALRNRSSAAQ